MVKLQDVGDIRVATSHIKNVQVKWLEMYLFCGMSNCHLFLHQAELMGLSQTNHPSFIGGAIAVVSLTAFSFTDDAYMTLY